MMPRPARTRPAPERKNRTLRARPALAEPMIRGGERPLPSVAPAAALPIDVARQAQREMDRLRRMPAGSPEAAQVRAYLQWLWSMPWERHSSEDANLRQVENVLERD